VTLRLLLLAGLVTGLTHLHAHPSPPAAVPDSAAVARPAPARSGQDATAPQTRAAIIAAARELMASARYCALITIGEDGQPQAREIDAFAPEDDMTVWLATKAASRKVAQIQKDPRVTLYYQEPNGSGYVTILGRAAIVTDPEEKARRWKDAWTPLYDDRNRGDDYTLVRVTPSRLEIVSLQHNLIGDPVTWRPASIEFGR